MPSYPAKRTIHSAQYRFFNGLLDTRRRRIYWADQRGQHRNTITRANLDGTGQKDVDTLPAGWVTALYIDEITQKMYWGARSTPYLNRPGFIELHRANLDGTEVEKLVTELSPQVRGITVDIHQ